VLARIIMFGLGGAVLSWLIAIPLRWYLLDMPARFAASGERPVEFDPGKLWPTEGPFVVLWPLWIVLMIGAWGFVIHWVMILWLGITTAVVGATQRNARHAVRIITFLLGATMATLAYRAFSDLRLGSLFGNPPFGLVPAILGANAVLFGVAARRLARRTRIAVVLAGLGAIGIYASYFTPLGAAMLQWHLD
jgi:hypothetical protein